MKGLFKGLGVTGKMLFKKKITQQYPEEKPNLPERYRGSFDYILEKCIACNMCANACPNKVIRVGTTTNEKGKKVLKDYDMNLGYCMNCNLCTEACPTGAIKFKTNFENNASYDKSNMLRHWEAKPYDKNGDQKE